MNDTKNITIYSTPTCPYCRQVKDYLKERGLEFTDYNVAADMDARNMMIQKSGQMGVPVIDVGGTVIIGFNRGKLEEVLA